MPKPDWEAIRKEMEAAQARYEAIPIPIEDTIEAITQALKNEGFKGGTVGGVEMTVDEMVFHDVMPVNEWQGVLRDWRYVNAEGNATNYFNDPPEGTGDKT